MKHQISRKGRNRGFSLVEMLVVIAVIGIVSAIAVPTIGSINGEASDAKSKRNAQTIASLYNSSRGVGTVYQNSDTSGIIDELVAGKTGAEIDGSYFQMSELTGDEKTAAMAFVSYDAASDLMIFDPTGGQATAAAQPPVDPNASLGWTLLAAFSTETEAEAQWALDYIAQHPGESYANGNFGGNDWNYFQNTDDMRWYLEFTPIT